MPLDDPWTSLPTLSNLFPNTGSSLYQSVIVVGDNLIRLAESSLLRPLSLFSFSRFRTIPALPSPSLLKPILDDPTTEDGLIKALTGVQTFTESLIAYRQRDKDCIERLVMLLLAYAHGVYAISGVIWGREQPCRRERADLHAALRACLRGLSVARDILAAVPNPSPDIIDAIQTTNKHLLGSSFPPSSHSLLTSIFTRPHHLLTTLQQAVRPNASTKIRTVPPAPISDIEAEHCSDILADFAEGVEKLAGDSVSQVGVAQRREARWTRLGMEARVLRCDVAMSMGTAVIGRVKGRAMARMRGYEAASERNEKETVGEGEEPRRNADGSEEGVRWEVLAEESLIQCLDIATALVVSRQGHVLTDQLKEDEWSCENVSKPKDSTLNDRSSQTIPLPCLAQIPKTTPSPRPPPMIAITTPPTHVPFEPCSAFTIATRSSASQSGSSYHLDIAAGWAGICAARKAGWVQREMRSARVWCESTISECLVVDKLVVSRYPDFGVQKLIKGECRETLLGFGLSGDKLDKWIEMGTRRGEKKVRRGRRSK